MHDPYDKSFQLAPAVTLTLDLLQGQRYVAERGTTILQICLFVSSNFQRFIISCIQITMEKYYLRLNVHAAVKKNWHTCQLFLGPWVVIRSDNNFRIILYSSKNFVERVACIKVLNYGNSLGKTMFKDKYLPLLFTVCVIKAIILIN